jgi:hypothetical protein
MQYHVYTRAKMVDGIFTSKANSCYAVCILQCLRRSLGSLQKDIDALIPSNGTPEDAHEYYEAILNLLSSQLHSQVKVRVKDMSTKENVHWTSHLRCTADMQMLCTHILHARTVICVYRNGTFDHQSKVGYVKPIDIRHCMQLQVGSYPGKITKYRACAFVCSVPGHYYALIGDSRVHDRYLNCWHICDGPSVRVSDRWDHPVYMIFYMLCAR